MTPTGYFKTAVKLAKNYPIGTILEDNMIVPGTQSYQTQDLIDVLTFEIGAKSFFVRCQFIWNSTPMKINFIVEVGVCFSMENLELSDCGEKIREVHCGDSFYYPKEESDLPLT